MKTQHQIIQEGYEALINTLGLTDTLRFIQYFQSGQGDYTKERHQWLEKKSVEDIFREIEQLPRDDLSKYDEVIK
jgi:hypothetical protein